MVKNGHMRAIDCADYDSMGNQGRFPMKTRKVNPSIFDTIINYVLRLKKKSK